MISRRRAGRSERVSRNPSPVWHRLLGPYPSRSPGSSRLPFRSTRIACANSRRCATRPWPGTPSRHSMRPGKAGRRLFSDREFIMLGGFAKSLFGSSNDRYVKSLGSIVNKINSFEPTISAMSDADLANQTVVFRERLVNGSKLDDLLPEAFATVREAAKRTL